MPDIAWRPPRGDAKAPAWVRRVRWVERAEEPRSAVREGRWGGPIWSAVQLVPAPGERSILLVALAAAGGATLTVMVQQARRRGTTREAGVVVLALACVAATNAANSQAWERYADLPLLLLLPWLAATGVRSARAGRALCGAAVVVAIAQVSIAFVTLWKPALGFIFGPAIGTTP